MERKATERQIEFIEVLAGKLGWDYGRVHTLARQNGIEFSCGYQNLTVADASKLIGMMKELAD